MHHSLDDINMILNGKATPAEREAFMDHLLECDACANQFKAMNALHVEASPATARKKHLLQLRYAVGVAAVMAMAIIPYFRDSRAVPQEPATMQATLEQPAPVSESAQVKAAPLSLLDRVKQVNYDNAVANWGTQNSVTDLIKLSENR